MCACDGDGERERERGGGRDYATASHLVFCTLVFLHTPPVVLCLSIFHPPLCLSLSYPAILKGRSSSPLWKPSITEAAFLTSPSVLYSACSPAHKTLLAPMASYSEAPVDCCTSFPLKVTSPRRHLQWMKMVVKATVQATSAPAK